MNRMKRRWKHRTWMFQESQRDIEEFLKSNDCPGVYKTRSLFALWILPAGKYNAFKGMIGKHEHVVLLSIVPEVMELGGDKFMSVTKFFLLTSRGAGYITFDKLDGDGGILARVQRKLDVKGFI